MTWYNTSWNYRIKITVNSSKVSANDTDVPIYVDLSNLPADFFTNVDTAGADIRVTQSDGTTECAFELVSIDTTAKTGELHFKANSISSSVDTDFYIYYGNAGATAYLATDTYGSQNVWGSTHEGVWHFENNTNDSTSNGYNLTNSGATYVSTGKLGGGYDFESTEGDGMSITKASAPNLAFAGDKTIMAWLKPESVGALGYWILDQTSGTGGYGLGLGYHSGSPSYAFGRFKLSVVGDAVSSVGITGGTFLLIGAKVTGATQDIMVNNTIESETGTGSNVAGTSDFTIGKRNNNSEYLDGILDELRVMNVYLSNSQWTTLYNNQSDPSTFWTVGTQETNAALKDFVSMGFIPFAR